MKTNFYIEYFGRQVNEQELIKAAKAIWAEKGNKATDLKSLNLYVKPEDDTAYYVFNNDESGSFAI